MLTRARTSSSTKETSAMAPTLADVMSELKSLKNVINVNADKGIIEKQNKTIECQNWKHGR